jgi:hypothetical protein
VVEVELDSVPARSCTGARAAASEDKNKRTRRIAISLRAAMEFTNLPEVD